MPDLNSLPVISHRPPPASSRTASRRASTQMAPSSLPPTSPSLNILPSNQSIVNHTTSPALASPTLPAMAQAGAGATAGPLVGDNTGVGMGPGPLRHPRPLTAADLHLQLEKEQEAVVNRLTRELSMLRAAQNASVVSNTSSTSAGFPDPADHNANHLLSGPSHPIPSHRHHRSSSSTSTRSITATAGSLSTVGGIAGSSTSGVAPERSRGTLPRHDSIPHSLSRQNSVTGSRRSGASSPALINSAQSSYQHPDHFPSFYSQRPIPHREPSAGHVPAAAEMLRSDSMTSVPTSGRYEETAYHRHELEAVKRENDLLKRRIRELEQTLRTRRQSDVSRTRSESVSTTASVSLRDAAIGAGRGRERDKEGEDDVVRVGESARSAGVLR